MDLIIVDSNQKWANFTKIARDTGTKIAFISIITPNKKQLCDLKNLKVLDVVPKEKLLERLPIILKEYFSNIGLDDETVGKDDSLYCRIATGLLLRYSPLKTDIYIRLSKNKFVKLFMKGDVFDKNDLERYLNQKKITYLYILKENVSELTDKLERDLLTTINNENATPEQLQQAAQASLEVIRETREKLGFTPSVQRLIKTTTRLMVKSAYQSPKLKELFINIAKNKEQYVAIHSTALAQISCSLARLMDWNSDTTYQKLTMASILHDITLMNPVIAEVQTLDELNARKKEFSHEETQKYLTHPNEAADLTLLMTEVLPDVDTVIAQHHELPDGTGFPRKLAGSRVSPLSAVFIIAHDLVYEIMQEDEGTLTIAKFLEKKRDKYSSWNFKKVMVALEKLIKPLDEAGPEN
jgi:HD-GYP domain-containing protein (c-di-GMP phosphodiesterase class II)